MQTLKIDIVSDVSCPWCIVGFRGLDIALENLSSDIAANIEWHPFELNPSMPSEGQEIGEHLSEKYGIDEAQIAQNREALQQRGLAVGYEFGNRGGGRIYNTFDAHRLLTWAKEQNKQTELKLALFDLYFKNQGNPSDHSQLLDTVASVGLPKAEAEEILNSDRYQQAVRDEQQQYRNLGISSVPAFIINNKYLLSGGQPADAFEQALQEIASQQAS